MVPAGYLLGNYNHSDRRMAELLSHSGETLMAFMNRKPREIGRLRDDYRPLVHAPEVEEAVETMIEHMKLPPKNGECFCSDAGCPDPLPKNCPKLPARQLDIMEELKLNCRRLTWAQMMEFCTATGADPTKVHEWSSKHE